MKLTPESVVRAIDYPRLRDQRNLLLNMLLQQEGQIYTKHSKEYIVDHLQGILNLLDDIHDAAITLDITPYMSRQPDEIRAVGKANHPES